VCSSDLAVSQNAWPSLRFDVGAVFDAFAAFMPAGFYYKAFMWPDWSWFEAAVRRVAGIGRAPDSPDADRYAHRHTHCDLLVVGAGPCGLAAALAAAQSGADVILCEQEPEVGGNLLWSDAEINGGSAIDFIQQARSALEESKRVRILTRTQVSGAYAHGFYTALEKVTDHLGPAAPTHLPRQRLWKIRARHTLTATGAIERPVVFPNNDRPGTLLSTAAEEYLFRYGVVVGSKAVLVTNNDHGVRTAIRLADGGLNVAAVVDSRDGLSSELAELLAQRGVAHLPAHCIIDVSGRIHATAVTVCQLDGAMRQTIACDTVLTAGGWSPTAHLYSQAGGKLRYDDNLATFRPDPDRAPNGLSVVGAANGEFGLGAAITDAWRETCGILETLGFKPPSQEPPHVADNDHALNITPHWSVSENLSSKRQWVDIQSDVTTKDVTQAAHEGYRSVELLKRYTTTGMATDQGKTSNINALALLANATNSPIGDVGTTTFRPPYTPIAFGAVAGPYVGELARPYRYLPSHDAHAASGAHFIESSGWLRPEHYPRAGETREDTVEREMRAVRSGVAVFDASPLGKILVSGPDAGKLLDHLYVGRASTLKPGRVRYGLMANEHGVVFDDGVFARIDNSQFWVSPSSGAADAVAESMNEWLTCEWPDWQVVIQPVTSQYAALVLAGPRSRDVLHALGTDIDLTPETFPHMSLRDGHVASTSARVFRVSFTGETQYEINVPASFSDSLWRACLEVGAPYGIAPVGLEAWLRLRIEKGYIHIGADSDGTTSPDDLGFTQWRKKDIDCIGRRSFTRPHMTAADRFQFVGLVSADPKIRLPVGGHILPQRGADIPASIEGRVTSSTLSCMTEQSIALALLKRGRARKGETVEIMFEGRRHLAQVTDPVFYDPQGERLNA